MVQEYLENNEPDDGDHAHHPVGGTSHWFAVDAEQEYTPAELAMGIILSLSIVGPLMKATTFINEAKSMEYAVEAANELLNLPVLPDSGKIVPIRHTDIVLQDVSFSYDGTGQTKCCMTSA